MGKIIDTDSIMYRKSYTSMGMFDFVYKVDIDKVPEVDISNIPQVKRIMDENKIFKEAIAEHAGFDR